MPGPSPEGKGHMVVERQGPQTDVCMCLGDVVRGTPAKEVQGPSHSSVLSLPILPGPQIQSPHDPSSSTVPCRCPWGTVLWEGGLSYGVAGSHTPLHGPAAATLLVPSTACPLLPCEPHTREDHDLSPDSGVVGCPRAPMIHLALGFLQQPSPHTCDVVAVSGPTWLLGGLGSECLLGQPQPGLPIIPPDPQSHPGGQWTAVIHPDSPTEGCRGRASVTQLPTQLGWRVQPQGVCDPETFLTGASPTLRSPFTTWLHKAEP